MRCDVDRCKRPGILWYSAFDFKKKKEVHLCEYHWEKHCDENDRFDLKEHFGGKIRRKP